MYNDCNKIESIYKFMYSDIPQQWDYIQCNNHYVKHGISEKRLDPKEIIKYFMSDLILEKIKNNINICFTHCGGGGTEEYLKKNIINNLVIRPMNISPNNNFVVIIDDNKFIHQIYDCDKIHIIELIKNNNIPCLILSYDELLLLLNNYKGEIFINHLFLIILKK